MDEEKSEKTSKNGSFHETDSFDEPKGAPISMEPVFSTAAGVRIDVKQESIDKTKKLLNTDLNASTSSKSFSSPLIKRSNGNSAFVSPFRRDEPSSSMTTRKRSAGNATEEIAEPPPKKPACEDSSEKKQKNGKVKKDKKKKKKKEKGKKKSHKKKIMKLTADVMRVSRNYERDQMRMVLQESEGSPLILAICSYVCGRSVKFGDKIQIEAEVKKKNDSNVATEIQFDKILKNDNNGARKHISRHPISCPPYCNRPRFIHELSDLEIKKTVLQVNVLDLNLEIYTGCVNCKHAITPDPETGRIQCSKCRESKTKTMVFGRMRVMDFSGQIYVNVKTKTMQKFLDMFGYDDVDQWIQFKEPHERANYVFQALMIEIEKDLSNEWECTDVAEMNWRAYADYLKEKEEKQLRRAEKKMKQLSNRNDSQ
ncbi:hypothetical protein B9Z55_028432 [Caenorhabditis nigoni]|uniref:Replication factor A C-terminal domain-containing protein n=1 Tax=Caenorhabditis nigoni TaxID=1611254 RepID=A0A2G5SBI9_9PELO|nr:hypothetical protein B9Z55_028432 [Caenorhabditis nigoni]